MPGVWCFYAHFFFIWAYKEGLGPVSEPGPSPAATAVITAMPAAKVVALFSGKNCARSSCGSCVSSMPIYEPFFCRGKKETEDEDERRRKRTVTLISGAAWTDTPDPVSSTTSIAMRAWLYVYVKPRARFTATASGDGAKTCAALHYIRIACSTLKPLRRTAKSRCSAKAELLFPLRALVRKHY